MTHPAPSFADMTADRIAAGRHSITADTQPWHLAASLIRFYGVPVKRAKRLATLTRDLFIARDAYDDLTVWKRHDDPRLNPLPVVRRCDVSSRVWAILA
ncbi:MAG TPA: hypothetical protein VFH56_08325, partial [Acidimicrobiales bacterium]|nr:hypothetical protein [Acidimicrobiales bacterium]